MSSSRIIWIKIVGNSLSLRYIILCKTIWKNWFSINFRTSVLNWDQLFVPFKIKFCLLSPKNDFQISTIPLDHYIGSFGILHSIGFAVWYNSCLKILNYPPKNLLKKGREIELNNLTGPFTFNLSWNSSIYSTAQLVLQLRSPAKSTKVVVFTLPLS